MSRETWTQQQDDHLLKIIQLTGARSWQRISDIFEKETLVAKSAKQCRE